MERIGMSQEERDYLNWLKRAKEGKEARHRRSARMAAAAKRVWGIGAVGYLGARLAGRKRAGSLPGAHDRRRHGLELGPVCRQRRDPAKHGSVVGVPGAEWPDGRRLHGSRFDVRSATATGREHRATARDESANATRPRVARTGDRLHRGLFTASERTH